MENESVLSQLNKIGNIEYFDLHDQELHLKHSS